MKNYAFTLAEVLITLGIIGIVAAMTIPVIVQRYEAKVIYTSLNKSYSELQNVVNIISNEYGEDILNIVNVLDNQQVKQLFMEYYDNPVDCNQGDCFTSQGIVYYTYTGGQGF